MEFQFSPSVRKDKNRSAHSGVELRPCFNSVPRLGRIKTVTFKGIAIASRLFQFSPSVRKDKNDIRAAYLAGLVDRFQFSPSVRKDKNRFSLPLDCDKFFRFNSVPRLGRIKTPLPSSPQSSLESFNSVPRLGRIKTDSSLRGLSVYYSFNSVPRLGRIKTWGDKSGRIASGCFNSVPRLGRIKTR